MMKNPEKPTTQEITGIDGTFNYQAEDPTADFLAEKIVDAIRKNGLTCPQQLGYFTVRSAIDNAGVSNQPNQPKFFKRLQKEFKKITEEKLPDELGGIIGDIHKQAMTTLKIPLWFKVTGNIQSIGMGFGNNRSCYYGDDSAYCHAPEVLENSDGIGILIYDKATKEHQDGIGRIWGINTDEGIAYFNPYLDLCEHGISRNKTDDIKNKFFTDLIAVEIMKLSKSGRAEYQNLDGKIFKVMEAGLEGTHIYINNDAQIITAEPEKVGSCYYPFNDANSYETCRHCDRDINEDDVYYNEDGDAYCQNCYNEHYGICENCNREVWLDDARTTENGIICRSCASDDYSQCHECDTYFKNDEVYPDNNGDSICEDCKEKYYYECAECGTIEKVEMANSVTDRDGNTITLCDDCIEDYTTDQQKLELIDREIERIRRDQAVSNYIISVQYNGSFQTITRSGMYYGERDVKELINCWNAENRGVTILSITKGILNITEKIMDNLVDLN